MLGNQDEHIYLGIDPGLADTGYGLVRQNDNQLELIVAGTIKTKKNTALEKRLSQIEKKTIQLIKK